MISAERVMGYSKLEHEAALETLLPHEKPAPEWPDKGEIKMDNVCLRYSEDVPLALKSMSFTVRSAEKV